MNMLGKNRDFDLIVISKQVDTQRMSFDLIRKWLYIKKKALRQALRNTIMKFFCRQNAFSNHSLLSSV